MLIVIILSIIILSSIMLIVIILSIIILSTIMLIMIILSAIMLGAVRASVVAPFSLFSFCKLYCDLFSSPE